MFNFRVLGDLGELRQLFHELWPADTFDSGRCVRCPFHADHEPSLSFYVATDGKVRYHCFGCQAHGDALDAVRQAKGMGFVEAAAFLAAREGTDVSSLMPRLQANRHEQAWLNALADHLRECLHTHSQGERVRAWLEKRGIPQATWMRLPVGLYPSGPEVGQFCRGRGMADDFIQLHTRRGRKWEGSLAFLYHRDYVNVSRVKLRVPEGRETEWLGKSGSDIGFFGLSCFQYRRDSRTLLVEGEFDLLVPQALALIEHGKTTNLLCRSGGAMRDKQALRKLASLGITHGYIFPDHDRGGLQYVEALLAHADGAPELLVVDPPEYQPGEDPAAFARRLNRFSTFQEAVQARRLLPWEWMARRIAAKFTATPEGQVKAREETIAYAKAHKLSGRALGDFLRAVAAVTGATVDELKVELSMAERSSHHGAITRRLRRA